jgi:hypothetical protein
MILSKSKTGTSATAAVDRHVIRNHPTAVRNDFIATAFPSKARKKLLAESTV